MPWWYARSEGADLVSAPDRLIRTAPSRAPRVAPFLYVQLRPHGLARSGRARADAPSVRERGDEKQAPPGLGQRVGRRRGTGRRLLLRAGVGHLDAYDVFGEREPDVEVPTGDVAVAYGVGGELRGDEGERLVDRACVGVTPGVQPVRDEPAGKTRTSGRRGEAHGELVFGRGALWHMPIRGRC